MDAPMREELLRRTGMALPRPFVEIATRFAERAGDVAKGLELFEHTVEMRLCHCIDDRYETMPIELFPILDTGGDGECFGYVVHAPELQPDDYPMASMVPGENNGVIFAGDATPAAIESMIARMRGRPEGFDDVDLAWLASHRTQARSRNGRPAHRQRMGAAVATNSRRLVPCHDRRWGGRSRARIAIQSRRHATAAAGRSARSLHRGSGRGDGRRPLRLGALSSEGRLVGALVAGLRRRAAAGQRSDAPHLPGARQDAARRQHDKYYTWLA